MKVGMKSVILGIGVMMVFASGFAFAKPIDSLSSLELVGLDTVAGYSTTIKANGALRGTDSWLIVQNPIGEQVKKELVADASGEFLYNLSAQDTTVSGEYFFAFTNGKSVSDVGKFKVFPGPISAEKSDVKPANIYLNAGESEKLSVKLVDAYENPIEGHLVKIVADKNEVVAKSEDDISDEFGNVKFSVSMLKSGVASFSVYDVTADTLISSGVKVAASNDLGVGSPSGAIDHFKFEDLPASLVKGENFSLKLRALDASEEIVLGYDGTVRFTVSGENSASVVLPDDYKFQIADQGEHVFSLAFLFQKAGIYHLTATDIDSLEVVGEVDLTILDAAGDGAGSSAVVIANPVAGTYSNNIQVISGNASAGSKLKIFDNEAELTSMIVGAAGTFSFTTAALEDGEHKIYAATVNDVGTIIDTSNVVTLNIDTFAPEISQVVLEPNDTVVPGSPVKVKLYTDSDLSSASVLFQDNIYALTKSAQGYFEGNLVAPNEIGEYKIEFVLKDKLGNESKVSDKAVLKVSNLLGEGGVPEISGLVATSDINRVILNWQSPTNAEQIIKNYRVYFGLTPNQLTQAVDTLTNATTWYVPNLQNGTQYYFAVVAVNAGGATSQKFSNVVGAVPGGSRVVVPVDVQNGTAGSEVFGGKQGEVSGTGPAMNWLILASCAAGVFYCNMRPWKRRKSSAL